LLDTSLKYQDSLEIQRTVDTSLDSCYSCNDSFVVTRDFRAICLGSINRRGIGRFAEEKLVD